MNAMPSPPPPDPDYWFGLANHIEGIVGVIGGAVLTALASVWRLAVWTQTVKGELEEMRQASDVRHETLLEKLDQMQDAQRERHEANKRELDQMHLDVRADREETRAMRQEAREASASLSTRIDSVFSRGA